MKRDAIEEIGIDDAGRLYVKPASTGFPYIYREGMEVHWDAEREVLTSPVPRDWSYGDWFRQIIAAAREQSVRLYPDEGTRWVNVGERLVNELRGIAKE